MNEPPIVDVHPRGSDKIWSMLSHLSILFGFGIVLPLIVYLAMRHDSETVAVNAREALNFHISVVVYGVLCGLLVLVLIGIPLLVLLGLGTLVLTIVAAVKASNGEAYRYPMTLRLIS